MLKFSAAPSNTDEGVAKTITIEFDDQSPNIVLSEKTITVPISISTTESDCSSDGGCATPDGDYTAIATTAFSDIAAGGTNTSIDVTPANDDRYESPQDIVINMGSPTNATISGGTQSHILTINDDVNDKPSAQFFNSSGDAAGSEDVTEETGSYTVRVKLDKVSEKTVTIPYTVDFTSNTAIIASDNLAGAQYPQALKADCLEFLRELILYFF